MYAVLSECENVLYRAKRDVLREFARNYDWRATRGNVTQRKVSCLADVTQSTVSALENGNVDTISYEALIELLTVYSCLVEARNGRAGELRDASCMAND